MSEVLEVLEVVLLAYIALQITKQSFCRKHRKD